jgi:EF hand/EF-hand domain pair
MINRVPEKFRKYIPGKKLTIGLAFGAMVIGGTAFAAHAAHSPADANGDGVVTRAESQALATQRFALLDANKDGKLDPADRAAAPQAIFAQIDTDKNGQISQAEFDAARMQRMGAGGQGMRGGWRDGGGHGGRHGGRGDGFGGRGAAMIALADTNKDGAVSQAEFAVRAQQRFDAIDGDKNGQLSAAERIAARMTLRGRWNAAPATTPTVPAVPAAPPAAGAKPAPAQ